MGGSETGVSSCLPPCGACVARMAPPLLTPTSSGLTTISPFSPSWLTPGFPEASVSLEQQAGGPGGQHRSAESGLQIPPASGHAPTRENKGFAHGKSDSCGSTPGKASRPHSDLRRLCTEPAGAMGPGLQLRVDQELPRDIGGISTGRMRNCPRKHEEPPQGT